MNFFVFDNNVNEVKIDEYSILLVKEFNDLWSIDRNKCKEDKTGKKRLLAKKELTYIYLMLDFKSPYIQYKEADKHNAALIDSGLKEKDLQDEIFRAAYRKYDEIQSSDPILSIIRTAYRTLFKLQIFYDSIDFTQDIDADGRLLYKPKEIIDGLASIDKMREQLKALEDKHKKGLAEAESKIRGDATAGLFDN